MAGLAIIRSILGQVEIRHRYVTDEELSTIAAILKTSPNDLYPGNMRRKFRPK